MKVRIGVALGPAGEPSRFGCLLQYVYRGGPDIDPAGLVADGWADARHKIEDYVAAGLTKFVVRPSGPPADPHQFMAEFAREMLPLQT